MTTLSRFARPIFALALSFASANTAIAAEQDKPDPERLDRAKHGYLTPAEFRKRYPAPEQLDDAVEAFAQAQRLVLTRARNGISAHVVLVAPDGTFGYGTDTYFAGAKRRLHEIRANYEAIVVDSTMCTAQLPERRWHCAPFAGEMSIGLRKIWRDAVVGVEHGEFLCDSGVCDEYRITQAYTLGDDGTAITAAPDDYHYVLSLMRRGDGTPIAFTERYRTTWKRTMPDATYLFDFDTPVTLFELPTPDP